MSRSIKILLWAVGAAAVLNTVADLWFRLAVSGATAAPWYVWAPVALTVAVLVVTILGGAAAKRWAQRRVESESEPEVAEHLTVEVEEAAGEADAGKRAHALAAHATGHDGWRVVHVQRRIRDGRCLYDCHVTCAQAPVLPGDTAQEHEPPQA